jgi:SAM-dependent methyltransferase
MTLSTRAEFVLEPSMSGIEPSCPACTPRFERTAIGSPCARRAAAAAAAGTACPRRCPEPGRYENPSGELIYPYLPVTAYESVLDFGCGCGRVARRLIQQNVQPRRYLGFDLHRGMVAWCQSNLTTRAPNFRFEHHDVYNAGLNPDGRDRMLPLPVANSSFSLFNAISVFTHTTQEQAEHYLREAARVLTRDGYLHASWFLFDKQLFPMMQPAQNALYTDETDLSSAVIFDRGWLRETAGAAGLTITWAEPGFQWAHRHAPERSQANRDVALRQRHSSTPVVAPCGLDSFEVGVQEPDISGHVEAAPDWDAHLELRVQRTCLF